MRRGRHISALLRSGLPIVVFALAPALHAQLPATQSPMPSSAQIPVLLVPGWGDDADDLAALRARLVEAGWTPYSVSALSFENSVGSNGVHADEVGRAVEALGHVTASPQVDIVAHSMGGLAVRSYLLTNPGDVRVRRVVFLATPHRGTVTAAIAWGDGGRELFPGSQFLAQLNEGRPRSDVEMLSVRTPLDMRVVPGSSAMLPDAYNIEICCPSHRGLLDDSETFDEVRLFLLYGSKWITLIDSTIPLGSAPRNP